MRFLQTNKWIKRLLLFSIAAMAIFYGYKTVQMPPNSPLPTVNEEMAALLASSPNRNFTPSVEEALPTPAAAPTPARISQATPKPRISSKQAVPAPSVMVTKLSINTATAEQLSDLPEIGSSKANAIVRYREQIQGFKTLDQLMEVKGIGPKIYEKLKDHIKL